MAPPPRYVLPGQPQHIIQRGNNRQAIFAAEADYRFFRDALIEACGEHELAIHAYVWMRRWCMNQMRAEFPLPRTDLTRARRS